MAVDPRKRQKKLAKKNAKRKEKRHLLVRERNAGIAEKFAAAVPFPVHEVVASDSIWTDGIGAVTLSRQMNNGMIAYARFLVDTRCLGVKDVVAEIINTSEYNDLRQRMNASGSYRQLTPADAVLLLEEAVAYAQDLGIRPPADYSKARVLFGDIDPAQGRLTVEFGKDGKPFFMQGPRDTPARCRFILNLLEANCGRGNYHFMIEMGALPARLEPEEVHKQALHFFEDEGVRNEADDEEPQVWEHPLQPEGDRS